MTAKKEKPKHSMLSNYAFMFKMFFRYEKRMVILSLITIPFSLILSLLPNVMSSYGIKLISEGGGAAEYVLFVLLLAGAIFIFKSAHEIITTKVGFCAMPFRFHSIQKYLDKTMDTDYENVESSDKQTLMRKAMDGGASDNGPLHKSTETFMSTASSFVGLITYSVLIITLSPWIVVVLLALTALNFFLERYYNNFTHSLRDEWAYARRRMGYLEKIAYDFEYAKDIRLYNLAGWIKELYLDAVNKNLRVHTKQENRLLLIGMLKAFSILIRDGGVYAFLMWRVTSGGMSPAELVWYFSLISQYSGYFYGVAEGYNSFHMQGLYFESAREYLEMPDSENGSEKYKASHSPSIEFKNVSFKYAGSDAETIKNVSFKINSGEKVALVGRNGAGKTTLVKLLCGMYRSYTGEILIDGKPLRSYAKEEYYKIIAAVFQDINFIPVSVARNIALCDDDSIDRERLLNAIKRAGLYEKVCSLPEKENTLMVKSVFDGAVDFSGGESQKLALARALYKGGKMLVLDEPTAALDPIAENKMYLAYSELTENTTSLFISHRLSSTRFCERIYMLDGGEIIESGTHDALMAQNGKYAEMFEIQSRYYKEGDKNEAEG